MNSVVLKGKLGAGFNDDRYTLPTDGNPGDILVKTETGSAWKKQEQGGGRLVVNGQLVEYGGRKRMMLDKTVSQIHKAYDSGKTVMLNLGESNTLMFNGNSFYVIIPSSEGSSGISAIAILLVGNPGRPEAGWTQSDELWDIAQFNLRMEG